MLLGKAMQSASIWVMSLCCKISKSMDGLAMLKSRTDPWPNKERKEFWLAHINLTSCQEKPNQCLSLEVASSLLVKKLIHTCPFHFIIHATQIKWLSCFNRD